MAVGRVSGAQLGPRGPKGAGVSPEELAAAVQAALAGYTPGPDDDSAYVEKQDVLALVVEAYYPSMQDYVDDPTFRNHPAAFNPQWSGSGVHDGKVYIPQGYSEAGGDIGAILIYDLTTHTFDSVGIPYPADAPAQLDGDATPLYWRAEGGYYGVIDGKVYFGGGDSNFFDDESGEPDRNGHGPWNATWGRQLWSYDIATETFGQCAVKPLGCDFVPFGVADGRLWVIGSDATPYDNRFLEVYDPTTDAWTTHDLTDTSPDVVLGARTFITTPPRDDVALEDVADDGWTFVVADNSYNPAGDLHMVLGKITLAEDAGVRVDFPPDLAARLDVDGSDSERLVSVGLVSGDRPNAGDVVPAQELKSLQYLAELNDWAHVADFGELAAGTWWLVVGLTAYSDIDMTWAESANLFTQGDVTVQTYDPTGPTQQAGPDWNQGVQVGRTLYWVDFGFALNLDTLVLTAIVDPGPNGDNPTWDADSSVVLDPDGHRIHVVFNRGHRIYDTATGEWSTGPWNGLALPYTNASGNSQQGRFTDWGFVASTVAFAPGEAPRFFLPNGVYSLQTRRIGATYDPTDRVRFRDPDDPDWTPIKAIGWSADDDHFAEYLPDEDGIWGQNRQLAWTTDVSGDGGGDGGFDDDPLPSASDIRVSEGNFTRLVGDNAQTAFEETDNLFEALFDIRNEDVERLNRLDGFSPYFSASDLDPARTVTTYQPARDVRLHTAPSNPHAGSHPRLVPMTTAASGFDLLVVGAVPWVPYSSSLGYVDATDRPTTDMGRSDSSSFGNIYVLGGKDTTGAVLDSLYSVDNQGGSPVGHSGVATTRPICAFVGVKTDHAQGSHAVDNPRVYAGLGAVADGTPSAYWGYFTRDNYPQWTWHSLPDAPVARADFGWALASHDDEDAWPARSNRIHVFGGRRLDGTPSHQVYDAEADVWSDAAPLPEDLGWCVAAMEVADAGTLNGNHEPVRIHVIGHVVDADLAGSPIHVASMRYFIYDVATDTWLDDWNAQAQGFPKGHQLPDGGPVFGFDLAWIAPWNAERQGYLMMGPGWGDGWDPTQPDAGPYSPWLVAGYVVNTNNPTTWYCQWDSNFPLIKDAWYAEMAHRVGYALASPSQYPVMLNGRYVHANGEVDWATTMAPICIPVVPATDLTPEALAADQYGTPLKVPSNIDDTKASMMLTRRDGNWQVDRPDFGPAAFDLFGWSMDPAAATGQTSALQPGRIYMSAFPGRSSFVGILHAHMEVLTPSGNGGVLSCALYRWNDLLLRFERLTLSVAHGSDTGGAVVLSFDFDASFQIHNGDGLWRMALLYLGDDPGPALRGASPVQSPLVQATSTPWRGSTRWQEATASVEFPTGVADSLPPYLTRIPNSAQVTVPSQVMPCIVVDR